jgi:elongation factor Ts
MTITPEIIKALRKRTGLSVMDCKNALIQTEGDIEQAVIVLRKKSSASAAKKSERDLGAGIVASYIHSSHTVGTIVLLSCETDFVAKNEEFMTLAHDIALHATATSPLCISRKDVDEEEIQRAKEVFLREVQDKPEDKREAILEGKIDSYFKEKVLLEQPFVKDPQSTIQMLLERASQKFGERVEISECRRVSV